MEMRTANAYLLVLCVFSAAACGDNEDSSSTEPAMTTDAGATGGTPLVSCNPVAQDCAPGSGCTLIGNSFQCAAIVRDGAAGDVCQEETECGLGLACLTGIKLVGCDTIKCCTPLCEVSETDYTCPGAAQGETCAAALVGDIQAAHQDYGVCRL